MLKKHQGFFCSQLFFREILKAVWYSKVTKGEHPKEEVKAEGRLPRSIHPLYTDRRIQQRKLLSFIKATLHVTEYM